MRALQDLAAILIFALIVLAIYAGLVRLIWPPEPPLLIQAHVPDDAIPPVRQCVPAIPPGVIPIARPDPSQVRNHA